MKSADLPDDPLPTPAPTDPRGEAWYQFLQEVDEAIMNYSWADVTLDGIRETVERTHQVTEGQRRAVANICRAERNRSRRYEGYSRRYR